MVAMGETLYDSSLLERIKARYEGRDGVGPEEGYRLVADAIAGEFGVHPNSIYHWARIFGWERPAWFLERRPKRPRAATDATGPVRVRLLALLTELAAAGAAVPSNRVLAPRFACTASGIVNALRCLHDSGDVKSETKGPLRRFRVGRAVTAWSVPPLERRVRRTRPALAKAAKKDERRSSDRGPSPAEILKDARERRDAKLLSLLKRLARTGQACPGDAEIARVARLPMGSVKHVLGRLAAAGELVLEFQPPNKRRVTLKDGAELGWSIGGAARPVIDVAAHDAVRALRRMGHVVFDVAVVTGKAWGVSWSVDGKILGRAALIALADERRAAAIGAMAGVA